MVWVEMSKKYINKEVLKYGLLLKMNWSLDVTVKILFKWRLFLKCIKYTVNKVCKVIPSNIYKWICSDFSSEND